MPPVIIKSTVGGEKLENDSVFHIHEIPFIFPVLRCSPSHRQARDCLLLVGGSEGIRQVRCYGVVTVCNIATTARTRSFSSRFTPRERERKEEEEAVARLSDEEQIVSSLPNTHTHAHTHPIISPPTNPLSTVTHTHTRCQAQGLFFVYLSLYKSTINSS